MKFVTNKLLYPGKSADFPTKERTSASPLAARLFDFPFVKSVFIASDFVTVTKTSDLQNWKEVSAVIREFLVDYLREGRTIINEDEYARQRFEDSNVVLSNDDDVVKRIKEILENYVKPAVEMDGGAIQFLSFEKGILNLKMHGACSGCPSSMRTLKEGIEKIMKQKIPQVKEVVAETL